MLFGVSTSLAKTMLRDLSPALLAQPSSIDPTPFTDLGSMVGCLRHHSQLAIACQGGLQRTSRYNELVSLVHLQQADRSVGNLLLLKSADLSIEAHERMCPVGRIGEGKSTVLKSISGKLRADDGEAHVKNGIVVACLPQDTAGSVFDALAEGLGNLAP